MTWRVWLPPFAHASALRELADALSMAFDGLPDDEPYRVRWVWLGAHASEGPPVPLDQVVIFQTECLESVAFEGAAYPARLARARAVWDYSTVNMGGYDARRKVHCPLGQSPAFERIARAQVQTIRIGFVGSVNDRRARVLAGTGATHIPFGTYGAKRDELLGQCRVVVVPHYYPDAPAEQVRIVPLAAAGIAVVAEYSPDSAHVPGVFVAYDTLVDGAQAAVGRYRELGDLAREQYLALPKMDTNVLEAIRCTNL